MIELTAQKGVLRRGLRPALLGALVALFATPPGSGQPTRYVAFGDSITEGINFDNCPCQCGEECGYPRRLQSRLRNAGINAVVRNRGLGAERTTEGLTRIDSVLEEGGDILLLMEGTNDIARISPETTTYNLKEMARKAAEAGLSTIHATLIPRYPDAWADTDNVLNGRLAQNLRELSFENGRGLIDPFEAFSNVPNLFNRYYAPVPEDPVGHPNARGYNLLTDVFFEALTNRDTVPPVLGPVLPWTNSEDLSPLTIVEFWLYDFGTGIDTSSVRLLINGSEVEFNAEGGPDGLEIMHLPTEPFAGGVSVRLIAQDLASPPNVTDIEATYFTVSGSVAEPCMPDENTLCIDNLPGDRRFKITMSWETAIGEGLSGDALATPLEAVGLSAGGLLSFFEGNPEVLIKVLNGCDSNDHFWLFGAPTTNLGFDLLIEDTVARRRGAHSSVYKYRLANPDGNSAEPFFDIEAFETCEFPE